MKLFPNMNQVAAVAMAALALMTGVAKADSLADIKAAGTINVGIFSDFPPFSSASADMSIKGYDIDAAQKIADSLGVKLNLVGSIANDASVLQ